MDVSSTTRRNASTARSLSVYSLRLTSPSPVAALHIASLSQTGILERLSMATVQLPDAAICHCSRSRGSLRSGAADGSTSSTKARAAQLFPVPCKPDRSRTGCGMSGSRAATSQTRISGQLSSLTLSNSRSSGKAPPRSGIGSAPVSAVRRNSKGDRSTTSHAPGRTITARPSASPRSITTPPSWAASRRCTDSASASSASPASTLSASASAEAPGVVVCSPRYSRASLAQRVAAALEHDRQVGTVALDGEQLILVGAAEAISLQRQAHQTLGHRGALSLRVWRRLGPPVGVSRPPRLRALGQPLNQRG